MNLILYIYIIFIISIFFEDLLIPLGVKSWTLAVSSLFCIICFLVTLVLKQKAFFTYIVNICKSRITPFWIYFCFVLYVFLITTIYMILGKVKWFIPYLGIFMAYIVIIGMSLVTASYISSKMIKPHKLVKIMYITFYIILLLGLLDFVLTNCGVLIGGERMLSIFHTKDLILKGHYTGVYDVRYNIARAQSIYMEAAVFAEMIFLMLPFLYNISLSKYKILNNNLLNSFVKKSAIPLALFCLTFTFSPMIIVLAIIFNILYFLPHFIKLLKKHSILSVVTSWGIIGIIAFSLIIYNTQNGFTNSGFVGRIGSVVSNITNIDKLIEAEQSLGTRLCHIINSFDVGLKSPFFGVGHGNIISSVVDQIREGRSVVFVPLEVIGHVSKAVPIVLLPCITNIFMSYGLVGLFLFYGFIIFTIKKLYDLSKHFYGQDKNILTGFAGMLICYILLSFYDFPVDEHIPHMILGFSIGLIVYYKQKIKNYKTNSNTSDE